MGRVVWGTQWEVGLVGRVLGMLSAACELSARSWMGSSSHWSLPHSICHARGICRAVEHREYHREPSMPGNPSEKVDGQAVWQQDRDTSMS